MLIVTLFCALYNSSKSVLYIALLLCKQMCKKVLGKINYTVASSDAVTPS